MRTSGWTSPCSDLASAEKKSASSWELREDFKVMVTSKEDIRRERIVQTLSGLTFSIFHKKSFFVLFCLVVFSFCFGLFTQRTDRPRNTTYSLSRRRSTASILLQSACSSARTVARNVARSTGSS